MFYCLYDSPIGTLRLRATEDGLVAVDHTNQQQTAESAWIENNNHAVLLQAKQELDLYFAGKLTTFKTPLAPRGTDFQLSVWKALQTIPYGKTATYGDIANTIGNPKSVRAVGAANARNPLSIFTPCHRVIGKNGTLTGYAGGVENKGILLRLEQKLSELDLT